MASKNELRQLRSELLAARALNDQLGQEVVVSRLLIGRLCQWLNFPVGVLESSTESPTMTLLIKTPAGWLRFITPTEMAYGTWEHLPETVDRGDEPDPHELRKRMLMMINGTLVYALRTEHVEPEEEEETTDVGTSGETNG